MCRAIDKLGSVRMLKRTDRLRQAKSIGPLQSLIKLDFLSKSGHPQTYC